MTEREQHLQEENERLRIENKLLREKVDLLVRKVFGASSEKLDANQLILLEEERRKKAEASACESPLAEAATSSKARQARQQARLPEDLPVKQQVLDPEEVQAAPHQWRCIGQEVSEQLDYQPGKFFKRRLIRRKFVRKDQPYRAPIIAPLPPSLQERCLGSPNLVAYVVISKYIDHLPLYRQQQIYQQRHGVVLPRQTLARWVELAAFWLKPIYLQMQKELRQSSYLQIDETPIRYLEPGNGKAPQGYLWTCAHPQGDVIYYWHTSRGSQCLDNIITADFRGILQCDGYQAYQSFYRKRAGPLQLAGCWAHVRRKFFEAKERAPATVGWVLNQIGHLYKIERQLREAKAAPALRQAMRSAQSRMIHQRLYHALVQLKAAGHYLPKSALGKAIDYTLSLWPMLSVYLEHGEVEIDNNLIENAIRPTAIGKKNWLFFGHRDAGQRSAILYSLIESCRRHGIDPHAWIVDVLHRLPKATNHQITELTPRTWAKAQTQRNLDQAAA